MDMDDTTTEVEVEVEVEADDTTAVADESDELTPVDEVDDNAETFPREYVEKLRNENGKYRQRAQRADGYAQRLHAELVKATGRLADPTDLPFDEAHLDDPDALAAAVDELLTRKPHLGARRPVGDIGQGVSGGGGTVDLAAILRQRAG